MIATSEHTAFAADSVPVRVDAQFPANQAVVRYPPGSRRYPPGSVGKSAHVLCGDCVCIFAPCR
jgi:hypothetical protein